MAAERYFAFNTLAGAFRSGTLNVLDGQTTAGSFDNTFVSNSIVVLTTTDYIETPAFMDAASTTTFWIHFDFYNSSSSFNTGLPWLSFYNSTGTEVARISANSNTMQFSYWNGSAFVNQGATPAGPTNSGRTRIDVKIVCGAAGGFELYLAGTLVSSSAGAGLNAAVNNIAKVRLRGFGGSGVYYSQILGANFDTRDSRLVPKLMTGNSVTNTGATGGFTEIDETVLDETDFISFANSGDVETYTHGAITVPGSMVIDSMVINGRGRINGAGPTDGKFVVRSSGTNYLSSALGLNSGFEPRSRNWTTDPATGSRWTATTFNNAEKGVQAV
jgi:hypothetical protein